VHRARAGDHGAFTRLLREHDPQLRGLAYTMLAGDAHAMDDVLQSAYLQAYRALPRYRAGAAVSTWLYRIVYNACIDELRRARRRPDPVDTREPAFDRPTRAPGPDAVVGRNATVRALAELPVDQRVTVVLVDGQGFSNNDAARILGVAPGTIASRLSRAHAHMRQILQPDGGTTADRTNRNVR
jgi:RNA polymerase sigma-70 factor, ECF subfamily